MSWKAGTVPTIKVLKELFRPFDTRLNVDKYKWNNLQRDKFKFASVLIPLFYKNNDIHVLLTVRAKHLVNQPGEVAFPGGMHDKEDPDMVVTAIREAEEEVGLPQTDVDVFATLTPGIIRFQSFVTPVLGLIPGDFKPKIDKSEVEFVFDLPLRRFLGEHNRTCQKYMAGHCTYNVFHFKDTVDDIQVDTWGFTAMFCVQTAMVVYQSDESICFWNGHLVTKENCFDVKSLQQIIEMTHARA